MSESLGKKATQGAIWASIDRFSMMGLRFAVNLILARLLIPADFGAIGMLTIFIAVSTVLIDGGFGYALIQKKNPTQTD
ncbi:MAG: oligosaccharide flippase family protein, partial [Muribaculaceae bacterium]|nr:oligosaccharide flippase family protein [Muribaculaceae bacterium]